MKVILFAISLASISAINTSCNNSQNDKNETDMKDSSKVIPATIRTDSISWKSDGQTYIGFVAYNGNVDGRRPAILVVPEWWGLNDYTKRRAKQLAELGYIAMAIDMYGDGKTAANPDEAQQFATPYYKNPALAKTRVDAAIAQLKNLPQTDTSRMAAIGYCFGGFVVLNAAKLGADLKGIVTFHGGLTGVKPDKNLLKAKILVCHGGADEFENPHVKEFKKQMDSIGADYTFKIYPNASHAFSNPDATAIGEKFNMPIRYNEAADTASWNDMKEFFRKLF